MQTAQTLLLALAFAGVILVALQHLLLARHLSRPPRSGHGAPGISILKPLCGVDDGLAANLERFAILAYPEYEVLLGIEHPGDPALPVARAAERRWPGRMRVVLRRGEPGTNPKVNQLLSLQAAARHRVLVVSDSNVIAGFDYLDEIASHLQDERVGLVTHLVTGSGGRRLGSRLDNLHLAAGIAAGTAAAKAMGQDLVTGKSMAMRCADLEAMGGFESVKDVLAEDFVLGQRVTRVLGKSVAIASRPVVNVSQDRGIGEFWARYRRWSVIQRQSVGAPTYALQAFLNPLPIAIAALVLAPSVSASLAVALIAGMKIAVDAASFSKLGAGRVSLLDLAALPLKDLLVCGVWASAFVTRRVMWRGKPLEVLPGTRLLPPPSRAKQSSSAVAAR